jgi:DNA-binding NtrC family response regulator
LRLLVIEDEERLSGILKSKLDDIGFTVDLASSAADASAALELIHYDAAILDLGLPDGDGLAVLTADMVDLTPQRHIPTLPHSAVHPRRPERRVCGRCPPFA